MNLKYIINHSSFFYETKQDPDDDDSQNEETVKFSNNLIVNLIMNVYLKIKSNDDSDWELFK